ncbi:MAG: hypothetical protein WAK23_21955 [Terriglobales bacterium]
METRISIPGVPALRQHLNRFAIATILTGAALLAVAWPAEAEIVYTKVNILIKSNRSYVLDLNHDGVIDFTISTTYGYQKCPPGSRAAFQASVLETPASGNGVAGSPPARLTAGDQIGSSQQFYAGTGEMADLRDCYPFFVQAFGNWVNSEFRAEAGYLGLMFEIDGETHYAWAHLSVVLGPKSTEATLTGYAYETIANVPINAGQTSGEDGSSALSPGPLDREDFDLSVSGSNPMQALSLGTCALDVQEVPLWRRKEHPEAAPETNSVQSEREIAQLSSQRTL